MSRARLDNPGSSVSPEDVQDIVGAALTDSTSIDFIYDDPTGTVTAEVLDSGVDHGGLGGLGDDDHTQYPLSAGRNGGQSITGGAGAGDKLTFFPGNTTGKLVLDTSGVTTASGQDGLINLPISTTLPAIHTWFALGGSQVINPSVNNFGIRALVVGGTFTIDSSTTGTPFLVFNFGTQLDLTGPGGGGAATTINTGNFTVYQAAIVTDIATDNAFADISQTGRSFHDITSWTRSGGVGTASFASYTTMNSFPNMAAGWSCTTALRCFNIAPTNNGTITLYEGAVLSTSGTGTYTDFRGFIVDSGTTNTFTNPPLSFRSLRAVTQMRHAGPGVFGADAAPSGVSVALEVQSTTQAFLVPRMTTAQKNALTALKGMIVYDTTTDTFEGFQGAGAGAWAPM